MIIAAVYSFSLLLVAGFPHLRMAYPLDDSWIHQVVARNLANDGTLGFIPAVRSSGSSSLLWSFILAAKWKFLPALNPVVYTYVISWITFVVIGVTMFLMARRDGLPETICWIWALAPALNGNFVWLGVIGMEHMLFAAISVGAIYFWFEHSRGSAVFAALCLGALTITRPEGVILAVLVLLVVRQAHRSYRDVLIAISIVTVFFVVGLIANRVTSNSWLPLTYVGRKWLYFGTENVPLATRIQFPLGVVMYTGFAWIGRAVFLLTGVTVILLALGLRRLWRLESRRCTVLCIWSGVLIAVYAALLPNMGIGGRYQPVFLLLTFPVMFIGLEAIISRLFRELRRGGMRAGAEVVVLLSLCLVSGVASLVKWRQVWHDGVTVIESTHARMGQYLVDNFHGQTKVAAFDIGRMGYIYGEHLSDLGGLTDSSFLPYLRQHRVLAYLNDRDIRYFVWPSSSDADTRLGAFLKLTPEVRQGLVTVARFCAPTDVWTTAFRCQTLYRLKGPESIAQSPGDDTLFPRH
ncbi:MAG: hypothetical protein JOZ33_10525 [Acidobacteriaceae bacterium]|nr:hypothetical protein [Acidobacteriaceae bacterium]